MTAFCFDFVKAFPGKSLATFVEVFLVEFATHIVEAHLVGCYTARLTTHHGVKDAVARLGEHSQQIGIQFDRLLSRMNLSLTICTAIDLPIQLGRLVE